MDGRAVLNWIVHWILSTKIVKLKCTMFRKLDALPSSDVSEGNNPSQLHPLGGVNLYHGQTRTMYNTMFM
jgi:hypothetical protein